MCYEGKCFYCIPVKRACLVLAIIIAIFNGLSLLPYVFYWGNLLVLYLRSGGTSEMVPYDYVDDDIAEADLPRSNKNYGLGSVRVKRCYGYRAQEEYPFEGLTVIWYLIVIPLVALLNFFFASLLCTGICNNRPKLVKACFWYGVVITVLAAIASMLMLYIDSHSHYYYWMTIKIYTELAMLLGCVFHALFLVMVHHAHKKVVQDSMFYAHTRLDDREFTAEKQLIKV